jgi:long-chain acyl-CoA synthetase
MVKSVPHLLFETIRKCPEKKALIYKRHGQIKHFDYESFGNQIRYLTSAFKVLDIRQNEKIAIISNNRPEWTITDFSIMCHRNVVVPIHQNIPPEQILYILKNSESRVIFIENEDHYAKIKEIESQLPKSKIIISYNEIDDEKIINYEDLIEKGRVAYHKDPDYFNNSMEKIDPREVCTIVYTSGTTGEPKGVMLYHEAFVKEIISSEDRLGLADDEVFLSFLPLSHLYERVAGHWTPMYRTNTIFYSEGINTVIEDIKIAKPTVIVSVPRLYEKITDKILNQIEHSSVIKQKMFYWALGVGKEYNARKYDKSLKWGIKKKFQLADKMVFSKIKKVLGGRLKFPIAGGAPLSVKTLKFFEAMGMNIIEGYGMTEAHLIIALTPAEKIRYGSCGKPLDILDVKIADDGEVLVKGPTALAGYFKNTKDTEEIIDKEGYLHTGDIGYLDEDNFLYLTDRKKNMIVTAGGKNIAAAPIESLLRKSKYIDEACLIGDKQRFISALIVPNFERLGKWAEKQGLKFSNNEELIELPKVKNFVWEEVEHQQEKLATFEKAKKIAMVPREFTIENEELTPSLKMRKKKIMENYKDVIQKIYDLNNVV